MSGFVDNNIEFEYDESIKTVIFNFIGTSKSVVSEQTRQKILNAISENDCYKGIICIKDIKLMTDDDIEWVRSVAIPAGMKNSSKGIICLALVFGTDAYSMFMAQVFILEQVINRNKLRYFSDIESAKKWLLRF